MPKTSWEYWFTTTTVVVSHQQKMSTIRDAKLYIKEKNLNHAEIDHLKTLLDGGQIVPNAVLTADHVELIDIIRRHPLSSQQGNNPY